MQNRHSIVDIVAIIMKGSFLTEADLLNSNSKIHFQAQARSLKMRKGTLLKCLLCTAHLLSVISATSQAHAVRWLPCYSSRSPQDRGTTYCLVPAAGSVGYAWLPAEFCFRNCPAEGQPKLCPLPWGQPAPTGWSTWGFKGLAPCLRRSTEASLALHHRPTSPSAPSCSPHHPLPWRLRPFPKNPPTHNSQSLRVFFQGTQPMTGGDDDFLLSQKTEVQKG